MNFDPSRYYTLRIAQLSVGLKKVIFFDRFLLTVKLLVAFSIPFIFLIEKLKTNFTMAFFPGLLVLLFFFHDPILKEMRRLQAQFRLLTKEKERISNDRFAKIPHWMSTQEEHPYDGDLNISEKKGLFTLLSRCQTQTGEKVLHEWLLNPCLDEERFLRQEAIAELKEQMKFRENFLSIEYFANGKQEEKKVVSDSLLVLDTRQVVHKSILYLFQVLTVLLIVSGLIWMTWWPLLFVFIGQFLLNIVTQRRQMHVMGNARGLWNKVRKIRVLLLEIEKASFTSHKLVHLKDQLFSQGVPTTRVLRKLEWFLQSLELRGSAIHPLVNNLFLWDLFWIAHILFWMDFNREKMITWFNCCGEIEALCSVATELFNHPRWTFPEFVPKLLYFDIKDLGHPLLSDQEQIFNNCTVSGPHKLSFISGPNMAGKSTYLRSVGTAIIMAQAGFPVCAAQMSLGQLFLITSLNHRDSLQEGKSLFHKELDRLAIMWSMSNVKGKPVFFILDEMLRGTNPVDRYVGSCWVLKLLTRLDASGMVATHDLRLTSIEDPDNHDLTVQNSHFSCQILADQCIFDYHLIPGVAPSVNALSLIRQRGLPIPNNEIVLTRENEGL